MMVMVIEIPRVRVGFGTAPQSPHLFSSSCVRVENTRQEKMTVGTITVLEL